MVPGRHFSCLLVPSFVIWASLFLLYLFIYLLTYVLIYASMSRIAISTSRLSSHCLENPIGWGSFSDDISRTSRNSGSLARVPHIKLAAAVRGVESQVSRRPHLLLEGGVGQAYPSHETEGRDGDFSKDHGLLWLKEGKSLPLGLHPSRPVTPDRHLVLLLVERDVSLLNFI